MKIRLHYEKLILLNTTAHIVTVGFFVSHARVNDCACLHVIEALTEKSALLKKNVMF